MRRKPSIMAACGYPQLYEALQKITQSFGGRRPYHQLLSPMGRALWPQFEKSPECFEIRIRDGAAALLLLAVQVDTPMKMRRAGGLKLRSSEERFETEKGGSANKRDDASHGAPFRCWEGYIKVRRPKPTPGDPIVIEDERR
jgi:hypothetical protein